MKNYKFHSPYHIASYNASQGKHFFAPKTMKCFGTRIHSGVLFGRWLIIKNNKSPNPAKFRAIAINDNGGISQSISLSTKAQAVNYINEINAKGYIVYGGEVYLNFNANKISIVRKDNSGYWAYKTPNKYTYIDTDKVERILNGAKNITFKNNRFYTSK